MTALDAARERGQAPYDAYRRACGALWLSDGGPRMPEAVEALPPVLQRAWEAVATQEPKPGPGDADLRHRVEDVAKGLATIYERGGRTRMAVAKDNLAKILRDILTETDQATQQPQTAPDARRALLDIIAELDGLDEPGPAADYIRMLAEYGLGEAAHPDGDGEPKRAPELAEAFTVGMQFARDLDAQDPAPGDLLSKRFFHLASEIENEWPESDGSNVAQAARGIARRIRKALDTDSPWREDPAPAEPKPAPALADAKAAVVAEIREAASCESDDEDQCEKCGRHADAILAAVAAQEPKAAPERDTAIEQAADRDRLRAELSETTAILNGLVEDVLRNTGDEWDGDEADVSLAAKYVRWLEAEVMRLGKARPAPAFVVGALREQGMRAVVVADVAAIATVPADPQLREQMAGLTAQWRDVAKRTRERPAASGQHAAYLQSGADAIEACADTLAKVLEGK